MTLYALIDTKNQKLMLISDSKKEVQFWTKGNDGYIVLSTDNISLSSAAKASVSMDYDEDCVKETVCTTLQEKGIDTNADSGTFDDLASTIAAEAYRSMIKYDTSEEYEIEEAMNSGLHITPQWKSLCRHPRYSLNEFIFSTHSAYHRPINSKRFKKKDFMKEV